MEILPIVLGLVAAAIGFFLGKGGVEKTMSNQIANAKTQVDQMLSQAKIDIEAQKKEQELMAKEQVLQLKSNAEREILQRQKEIEELERKVKQKDNSVNQKNNNLKSKEKEVLKLKDNVTKEIDGIDKKRNELDKKRNELVAKGKKLDAEKKKITEQETSIKKKEKKMLEEVEKKRKEIEQKHKEAEQTLKEKEESIEGELLSKLEAVSGLSQEAAKAQLIEAMTKKAETDAMAHVKMIVDEAKQKASREAKKIIIQTIQRTAAEQAIENAVTVFNLDTDDIKGQIIGREGRNIRALEAATGIEIIVDDTPEAVVISGYDPFRREVARLSLKRLVADGRIHPARIEEVVNKTRKQLEQEVIEIGERTVIELNIHGLHPKLIQLVGKMRFRSSYGQNLLQHSKETARICAIMASELGLTKKSVRMAMRAGLLHDIGKVSDENPELSHALLGMELTKKYNEKDPIVNAVGAHHDEVEMTHMISPIVQASDAISGSRPGARREILETYLQRIRDLEELAVSYEGVQKAYAIQAGRELRVIVESDEVSDKRIEELSFEISQKIQSEMQYPGQIKVTVIREKRAVSYAK